MASLRFGPAADTESAVSVSIPNRERKWSAFGSSQAAAALVVVASWKDLPLDHGRIWCARAEPPEVLLECGSSPPSWGCDVHLGPCPPEWLAPRR